MSEQTIASIAGIIISLAFSYVPGLKDKYGELSGQSKALVMLGALLLACGVIFGAACLDFWQMVACNAEGAKSLVPLFISAAIANQGTYLLTRKI